MSNSSIAKVSSSVSVKRAGMQEFTTFLKSREAAIKNVGASFMNPQRVTRIVLGCVSRTPKLQDCTMQSILRSVLQAAELGLEPGSAVGEAYLVPYKDNCQMIPGYRGLISLAYRSGQVKSIQAREVYEGDVFEFELGLNPTLKHIPTGEADNDSDKITHAYCVIQLKSGGVIHDTMTRKEIDRIRGRSKASSNGPWVTDYAEMAKKTVTRRTLKYCPMSIEMSKAIAVDNEADTGESSVAEFDILEGEFSEEPEQSQPPRTTGVDALKEKLGVTSPAEPTQTDPGEDIRVDLLKRAGNLVSAMYQNEALRETVIKKHLGDTPFDQASVDQLNVMIESLEAELKKKGEASG